MNAMYDATCPRCKAHIGWRGRPIDQPPCGRCGHVVDRATLERDQAEFERGIEMSNAKTPRTKSGKTEAAWIQDWSPEAIFYVGRRHPRFPGCGTFGNPFAKKPGVRGTVHVESVEAAVGLYRRWLEGDPAAAALLPGSEVERRAKILRNLPRLRGLRLGCWRHNGPCHAGVLAELADGPLGDPRPEPYEVEDPS